MTEYSDFDRSLAKSILALDKAGISSALEQGAQAHKSPFKGVSWAMIPVCVSMHNTQPSEAMTDDVRAMVRNLIGAGAPTTGLSRLVGSGVHFSDGDMSYFLDNWLWKDSEEVKLVAKKMLDRDDILCQLVETGHVAAADLTEDGVTMFEAMVRGDLHRSVNALGMAGADINASIVVDGQSMPAIEAAAQLGNLTTLNALINSGAFYDEANVLLKAERHGSEKVAIALACIRGFEQSEPLTSADVTKKLSAIKSPAMGAA
jgi:hypothetical protein